MKVRLGILVLLLMTMATTGAYGCVPGVSASEAIAVVRQYEIDRYVSQGQCTRHLVSGEWTASHEGKGCWRVTLQTEDGNEVYWWHYYERTGTIEYLGTEGEELSETENRRPIVLLPPQSVPATIP